MSPTNLWVPVVMVMHAGFQILADEVRILGCLPHNVVEV